MQRRTRFRRAVCALTTVVLLASSASAFAQTQGMQRRDDRRDNRDAARAVKHACKAGDDKSRAECRQQKRNAKHGTQGSGSAGTTTAPAQPVQ